ncbi:MAG: FkbM family methyltransferase [Planctomycetes bacterium]|nr:FkbM family methyltransferase [Planctomycetota bacterium]
MQFHPLEPALLPRWRRALLPLHLPVARLLRWCWRRSGLARSTWFDSRRWRAVWNIGRCLGAVPRARPTPVVVRFAPRIVMELDLSRLTDVLALGFGPGENEVAFACRRLCPEDGVVADVGGNIGTTALAFAAAVPAGRVHVFEPAPDMLACLRRNLELSRVAHVVVHGLGLGRAPGTARLRVAIPGNPGSAFLADGGQGVDVEVARLDDVLASAERLDFVKIDVEGLELEVLHGATGLLRRHRPVLLFEVNEAALQRAGTSGLEVCRFVQELGYELRWLASGRLRPYDPATMVGRKLHNVIAVPGARAVSAAPVA